MKTEQWKRLGIIATAIIAMSGLIWSAIGFTTDSIESITAAKIDKELPKIVDNKIKTHNVEVSKKITDILSQLQYQSYSMESRIIKSEIKTLTQNKTINDLTALEKSEFDYLIEEQKNIQIQKRKLKDK